MRAALLVSALVLAGAVPLAAAHTTVDIGQYSIEAGWGTEPPVVGIRNTIVLEVTERGETAGVLTGVKNAFANLDVTIQFGGAQKQLDISTDIRPGEYFSNIIPTKTGSYMVTIAGQLNDMPVSVEIPVEAVESTAILDFPPRTQGGSADVAPLKQAVADLQRDVAGLKGGTGGGGSSYDISLFAAAIGAAGVILAVIAMAKRK